MVAPRVAVVTGANKGIGYHIAQSLVHSGLFGVVVLGCRDPSRGQQAAAAIGGCAEYMPLEVGNAASADAFAEALVARHGRCDVLVNNAGIAFKDADPTPFAEQTKPTLDVNYRGTIALTKRLLPLLQTGDDPRIVNVASMAGKLKQLQPPLQARFSAASLTLRELDGLVDQFEADVQAGTHQARGWGRSNYGLSKLALIAATQVLGRECLDIKVNSCCPGYCDTDMTSHRGPRSTHDGAQNAVMLATLPRSELPSGAFFQNGKVSAW